MDKNTDKQLPFVIVVYEMPIYFTHRSVFSLTADKRFPCDHHYLEKSLLNNWDIRMIAKKNEMAFVRPFWTKCLSILLTGGILLTAV